MNIIRILALIRRIVRQIALDRRTVALVIAAPMLLLTLGSVLFRADAAPVRLGVDNQDEGILLSGVAPSLSIGERLVEALKDAGAVEITPVEPDQSDALLEADTVDAVLKLPADFTSKFVLGDAQKLVIPLRLEGTNPSDSQKITALVTQAAAAALSSLQEAPGQSSGLPVSVETSFLHPTQDLDFFDYFAPAYIAFLAFFFVFLLTCVSFLRERSQGTLERLLATPVKRFEILLGYMGGLGLFAMIQVVIIVSFTILVLKVHFLGSLWLLAAIIALLALTGVTLGILASTFARNEFQVIQFIPIVIIPQALLCGMIWPIKDMPAYLQPLAYVMPLTYANRALDSIMLKGQGLAAIGADLAILAGFILVILGLAALTIRREVA